MAHPGQGLTNADIYPSSILYRKHIRLFGGVFGRCRDLYSVQTMNATVFHLSEQIRGTTLSHLQYALYCLLVTWDSVTSCLSVPLGDVWSYPLLSCSSWRGWSLNVALLHLKREEESIWRNLQMVVIACHQGPERFRTTRPSFPLQGWWIWARDSHWNDKILTSWLETLDRWLALQACIGQIRVRWDGKSTYWVTLACYMNRRRHCWNSLLQISNRWNSRTQ